MNAQHMPALSAADLELRGATWTAREIAQQPAMWREVARLVDAEANRLNAFLKPLLAMRDLRVVLTGAGTSSYIGSCLAPAVRGRSRLQVDAIPTTDLVSGPGLSLKREQPTLLVSFARSGNSPESVAAVDLAEQCIDNVHHLIITCNPDGELAKRAMRSRSSQLLVLPEATNDRGFAMTSSFTSMLLAAGLLFGAIRREWAGALAKSAEQLLEQIWPLAQSLVAKKFERVVYLGSNELSGLAAEAALKLLELTDGQTVAMAQSTLGFRHGPKTIINARTLVVVMLSNEDYTSAYDRDLIAELRRDAKAGGLLLLSPRAANADAAEHTVVLPDMERARDIEAALLHILPAQAYALSQSLALGLTPDRPNAAGVVNRVVQGVNIYPWRGDEHGVSRG